MIKILCWFGLIWVILCVLSVLFDSADNDDDDGFGMDFGD